MADLYIKIKAIDCAEHYGVERAAAYYKVDIPLLCKWIRNKESLIEKNEVLKEKQRQYIRRRHKEGTLKKYPYNKKQHRIFTRMAQQINRSVKRRGHILSAISAIELWKLALRQKLRCALSGLKLGHKNISPDHIVSVSKGGTNEIINIQLIDKRINFMKHVLNGEEFIELCHLIAKHNPR